MLTIRSVQAIVTAPQGINLVVVKVETSEPGLYGLGCATYTQRCLSVVSAVEQYLAPLPPGATPTASRSCGTWRWSTATGATGRC